MKIIVDHIFQDVFVDGVHRFSRGECFFIGWGKRSVMLGGFLVEGFGFFRFSIHQIHKGLIMYTFRELFGGIAKVEDIFFREVDTFFFFPVLTDISQYVGDLEGMSQGDGVGSCLRACAEECRADNADTGGYFVGIAEQVVKGATGKGGYVRGTAIDDADHGIKINVVPVNEPEDFFLEFIFGGNVFVFAQKPSPAVETGIFFFRRRAYIVCEIIDDSAECVEYL